MKKIDTSQLEDCNRDECKDIIEEIKLDTSKHDKPQEIHDD